MKKYKMMKKNKCKKGWAAVAISCVALAMTSTSSATTIVIFEEVAVGGVTNVTATWTGSISWETDGIPASASSGYFGSYRANYGDNNAGSDHLVGEGKPSTEYWVTPASGTVPDSTNYDDTFFLAGRPVTTSLTFAKEFDTTSPVGVIITNTSSIGPSRFGFKSHHLLLPGSIGHGHAQTGTYDFDSELHQITFEDTSLELMGVLGYKDQLAWQALVDGDTTTAPTGDKILYTAIAPAPEPSSALLLGLGTLGLIARRRR